MFDVASTRNEKQPESVFRAWVPDYCRASLYYVASTAPCIRLSSSQVCRHTTYDEERGHLCQGVSQTAHMLINYIMVNRYRVQSRYR
jgi:hypothetical protein